MASAVETLNPSEEYTACPCCHGDEALYWQDSENHAFIDVSGVILVTAQGKKIRFFVDCCPKCGRKFH